MTRTIVTTCGKELHRNMLDLGELRRQDMRNALIGCGILDKGVYVEIADVYFTA